MGLHWKVQFLGREGGRGSLRSSMLGDCLKRGGEGLGQFASLRGVNYLKF